MIGVLYQLAFVAVHVGLLGGVGVYGASDDVKADASQSQFIVDTGYARYRGRLSNSPGLSNPPVLYLGLPYANPPTGNNRFRAPPPLDKASLKKDRDAGKVVDATEYPEFCVQGSIGQGDAGGAGSEDCLKVNVYTPKGAKSGSNLPVLVYIHGGGYTNGNPANWPFDQWVSQSPNVVVVSVYYRLDSLGFLTHPTFLSNPTTNPNGPVENIATIGDLNAGFLDQRLALHWVKENVKVFGGDASKVTIMGQSAGASSVELHLIATPPNEPSPNLYRAAIPQSVYRIPLPTLEQQVPLFESYAQLAGCGDALAKDKAGGDGTVVFTMECLRAADLSALARAQDARKNVSYSSFHPAVDGHTIKDFPTRLFQKGIWHQVDILAGSTSNETLTGGVTDLAALQAYFPSITADDVSKIEELYPASEFDSAADRMTVLTGDHTVRCGRQITTSAAHAAGKQAFSYRFNAAVPPNTVVFHSSDNWYLFNGTSTGFNGTTVFQPQNATQFALAQEEIAYLLSFIRTSDPNAEKMSKSPDWPGWDPKSPKRIVLSQDLGDAKGSASASEAVTQEEIQRCLLSANLVDHEQN